MAEPFENGCFPVYHVELDKYYRPFLVHDRMIADVFGNRLNSQRAYKLLCDEFHADALAVENSWVIALNPRMKVVGMFLVGQGNQSSTLASVSEVVRGVLLAGGDRAIVSHNHPSGESSPSDIDRAATRRLVNAGRIAEIEILDHIVCGRGEDNYYSFREHEPSLWTLDII